MHYKNISKQECYNCPIGKFQNKKGQNKCNMCPFGKYQNKTKGKKCNKSIECNKYEFNIMSFQNRTLYQSKCITCYKLIGVIRLITILSMSIFLAIFLLIKPDKIT